MKKILLFFFLFFYITICYSQDQIIHIWKDVESMKKEKSRLYVFEPPDSVKTNISVIVCPGGSYAHLFAIKSEGFEVAKWLNENGITAFVLKYRVGSKGYHHPAMIEDVQRAIQIVKDNAEKFNIDADLLGVMGFSAGGHLSLMAGAFSNENYLNNLGINVSTNLRPAFVVPIYPVVSMQDSIVHSRSRKNLLGKKPDENKINKFSMELQVNEKMPPVFLVTTKDDPVVNYKNSLALNMALSNTGIPYKFLLYDFGGHGFGVNEQKGGEAANWKNYFKEWLFEIELLN